MTTTPNQAFDPETACAMWCDQTTTPGEMSAFLAGARAAIAALHEQQPAGDGGPDFHARFQAAANAIVRAYKREMGREMGLTLAEQLSYDALKAADRLTAAGRGGEGDWVLVPKSAMAWLNGECGTEFECPPDLYFRGKPAPYWWRVEFDRRIAAAAPQQPPPDPEFERLATECYAALAKAVSAAGFHINARSSGEFYLTPKAQQPPPVGVTDAVRTEIDELLHKCLGLATDINNDDGDNWLNLSADLKATLQQALSIRTGLAIFRHPKYAAALSHQQAAPSVSEKPRVHIGTIGHVDHGKTVLRAALTKVAMGEVSTPTAPEPAASGEAAWPLPDSYHGTIFYCEWPGHGRVVSAIQHDAKVQEIHDDYRQRLAEAEARIAAAPQQPPPVGVTDALVTLRSEAQALLDNAGKRLDHMADTKALAAYDWWVGRRDTLVELLENALSHQQPAPSAPSAAEMMFDSSGAMVVPAPPVEGGQPAPVSEPATSGEGLLRFVRDFLAEYEEHEEGEWSQHWQGLGERARDLIAANVSPPAVKRDALYELAAELEEFANTPLRILKIASNVRRFSGQGDVERLVEAAREVAETVEHEGLDAALRPFGQQQEGA